ncbi:MAG TPA: hypothetical protein VGF36_01640 [Rhodopila sp.]|jgi:hypothetical protein
MSGWNATDALAPAVDWSAGTVPGTTSRVDPGTSGAAGSTGTLFGTGTGQHGVVPIAGMGASSMGDGLQAAWQFINAPFTTPLDPVDLFLIVGIVLVSVVLWNLILWHVRIAAETI